MDGFTYILGYRKDGTEIKNILEWGKLFEDEDYKRVAETTIDTNLGDVWISTVWLGLDHSFGLGGPPLIFETMAFDHGETSPNLWDEMTCERYTTEAGAIAGHDQMVMRVREALTLQPGRVITTIA